MSLICDKRNNILLGSQLNTLHIMEEGDKVGIFYNFIPTKQETWKATWDNAIQDMRDNIPTSHNKISIGYVLLLALNLSVKFVDIVLDSLSFSDLKVEETKKLKDLELSRATKEKRDKDIVMSQIICFSQSDNKDREENNAISLCNSFECLQEDNVLTYKKIKKNNVNLLDTVIKGADTFKIQPREGQNFISLPAKELLEEYRVIPHTKIRKELPPKELLDGVIPLGTCDGANNEPIMAYMPNTKTQKNLPFVIVGANRSGKSTFLQNVSFYAQKGKIQLL
jgi:hypothetical protein